MNEKEILGINDNELLTLEEVVDWVEEHEDPDKQVYEKDGVIYNEYDSITYKDVETLSEEEQKRIDNYRTWDMSAVEYLRYKQFCKEHKDCLRREDGMPKFGAIGGGIVVSFMGTGLGSIVHCSCGGCGKTYDITDSDSW